MTEEFQNKLILISKIYNNWNGKFFSEECSARLMLLTGEFIEQFPSVFNEKLDVNGILNVLNKNLDNIYNNKDIFEQYFLNNKNEIFNVRYEIYLNMLNQAIINSNGIFEKINVYKDTIEKINVYLNFVKK